MEQDGQLVSMEPDAPFAPRFNYYRCPKCHAVMVTVDIADGVTPAFYRCLGGAMTCNGNMASAWYPPLAQWPRTVYRATPDGVWFKPNKFEIDKMKKAKQHGAVEHARRGGLWLRHWKEGDPTLPELPAKENSIDV